MSVKRGNSQSLRHRVINQQKNLHRSPFRVKLAKIIFRKYAITVIYNTGHYSKMNSKRRNKTKQNKITTKRVIRFVVVKIK